MNHQRVIVYIDGFNLYYGLKAKNWQKYYWLNLHSFAANLLKDNQLLQKVKYFTSLVSSTPSDPNKNKRQKTYIEALETLPNIQIFYGHYLTSPVQCYNCGYRWSLPNEKMTDVNIATEMLVDSFYNNFDMALLISADSDLIAPIKKISELFSEKKIIIAFPPERFSKNLSICASAYFIIGRTKFSDNQFPQVVKKSDGFELVRPASWK
jgi:hypothetical protein